MPEPIQWEDPPAWVDNVRGVSWSSEFVEQLKLAPGRWALVTTPDGVDLVRPSMKKRFQQLGCDVKSTSRGVDTPNMIKLWARWPETSDG